VMQITVRAITGCQMAFRPRLAGMIPSRDKGNAMTDLNKEVCELTSDELKIEELDAVTAGSKIGNFIAALRLEILVQYVKAHDSEMMVRELF
jgi:hypothetical protein